MQNETFNNLVTIKQRIDEQRAALKTELEKLETDLERKISGQSEKPNSLALDDVLNANKTETVEEISRKIANIKAALAMPYYADSEFRAASIAYMEEMTANYTAELAAKAAARCGSGLIYVGVPESVYPIVASKLTEPMVFPLAEREL